MEIKRFGEATVRIVGGAAQLQAHPVRTKNGPALDLGLNDERGWWDTETGITGGSIALDVAGALALRDACAEFASQHAPPRPTPCEAFDTSKAHDVPPVSLEQALNEATRTLPDGSTIPASTGLTAWNPEWDTK